MSIESSNKPNSDYNDSPARFATTQWSMVLSAGTDSQENANRALDSLCQQYWYPLYAFLRRRGMSHDQSQDLTQAFFVHLLEKKSYEKADPTRGRFRTFLMTAINNFVSNHWRAENAAKRKPKTSLLSIQFEEGEKRYDLEPQIDVTAEKLFERRWGLTVLQNAMNQLEESYNDDGKGELFQALKPVLVGGSDTLKQQELAKQLDMSHGAVRVAIHRMRKKCREMLRKEISQTVESSDDIDQELRYLLEVIAS